jgi:hypothetical protein
MHTIMDRELQIGNKSYQWIQINESYYDKVNLQYNISASLIALPDFNLWIGD